MSIKKYDIAIIGSSLSARIAAALLAKLGSKVLFLRYREVTASEWFPSSLFLEKLLGTLGGRSCFVAQEPIQILSSKARITLNNDIPLDAELIREFGQDGPVVLRWLNELKAKGTDLENILWENGGLPWPSFKATASLKLLSIRHRINWSELDAPITDAMRQLPDAAVEFVKDLLQGLSLKRVNELSHAQAALLWTQALRPENLKEPDFSTLLSKRFDQFHGLKTDLEELECIDFNGSRWTGGKIKGGGQFTAATFLLGDARFIDRFDSGKLTKMSLPKTLVRLTTSSLSGQLSPLLTSRVICGGEMPLRLAMVGDKNDLCGHLICADQVQEEQLRNQLKAVLPFAKYDLSAEEEPLLKQIVPDTENLQSRLRKLPLRIGSNLYCADSSVLLPEMGASGAALLGWTLAENLTSKHKPGSE